MAEQKLDDAALRRALCRCFTKTLMPRTGTSVYLLLCESDLCGASPIQIAKVFQEDQGCRILFRTSQCIIRCFTYQCRSGHPPSLANSYIFRMPGSPDRPMSSRMSAAPVVSSLTLESK
ncbi:hypothetical protein MRB53_039498 [Persea americana]|nr:hypothetical protein MRB53_039498 [Persea americana]